MPIIILCVCNTWIVVKLTKTNKKNEKLFLNNGSDQSKVRKFRFVSKKKQQQREEIAMSGTNGEIEEFNSCENLNRNAVMNDSLTMKSKLF